MIAGLRDYQTVAVAELRARMAALPRGQRRALLVSPTGSGKTTCAADIIAGAVAKGNPVLLLAHRKELIEQAAARFVSAGMACGIIKAGRPATPDAPVQVASVQTLTARKQRPPAALVVVDEAHRTIGASYLAILQDYPDATVVGLTATPIRLDGRGLGDVYNALVEAASVRELVDAGFLVKTRVFAPATPDLAGVRTTAGDYNQLELVSAMNKPQLVGDIVQHWLKLADNQRTVVFAAGVEHSRAIADTFRAAGVAAEHLDGETPDDEREAILARLAAGTTRVVCNFGVLVEGWDCPAVGVVVLARPTKSLGQYLQMVGRGMRPHEDKTVLLVQDHAGCTFMHGLVTEEREWSLDPKKKAKREQAPSLKNCPGCYFVMAAACATCPDCGRAQQEASKILDRAKGPKTKAGELQELTEDQLRARRDPQPSRAFWRSMHPEALNKHASLDAQRELYMDLARYARARAYKATWAVTWFQLVTGRYPSGKVRAAALEEIV